MTGYSGNNLNGSAPPRPRLPKMRKGRFTIPGTTVHGPDAAEIFGALQFVPMISEWIPGSRSYHYEGLSSCFEEVDFDLRCPMYEINAVNDNGVMTVTVRRTGK